MIAALLSLSIAALSINAQAKAALHEHREAGDLPGVSAAIVIGGKIRFEGGAGVADLQSGRPMTAHTPLYAGSLSKLFTATLALGMVDDGDLSLATRATTGGAVDLASVSDLLTHSSGLPREGNFNYWFTGVFPNAEKLDAYLQGVALQNEPGTRSVYSNIGYATLGRILEKFSGRPYAEILSERLLLPLELEVTGASGIPDHIARGYTPAGRVIPSADRPFAGVGDAVGNRRLREYHNAGAMTPAFGIYSSAVDLARIGAFIVGKDRKDLLSPELRHRMLTAQQGVRGFALRIDSVNGRSVARHGGRFAAHRSHILLDDQADIAVVVLTNCDDGDPETLAEALYTIAVERLGEDQSAN